ncbi:hypothetical protein BT96DRAFT_926072, partial [Gymnopus androsaceus JB14]
GKVVRRILNVDAKEVYWSTTDSLVAIVAEDSFYMLNLTVTRMRTNNEWSEVELMMEGFEEALNY